MALDNFRKINITLNKANQHILEPQIAKVGDVNGRELVVQLIDGGVIKDQTGVTLKLNWQHANGNKGSETFKALDAKQGLFSVFYPDNMLYRGTVTANIVINEHGKVTNSLNFQINVQGEVFDGSAVEVDGLLFDLKDLKNQIDERDNSLGILENRQNEVESQFNSVKQELTDKDVISAPEIIAARNGEANLKTRLDKEQQKLDVRLQHTNLSYPDNVQTTFSFVDDDGQKGVMTKLKPIFDRKGVKFTTAIVQDWVGKDRYMTIEEIKQLQREGHEIAGHTKTHRSMIVVANDFPEDLHDELQGVKDFLESHNLKVEHFMYPFGHYNDLAIKAVRDVYKSAATMDYDWQTDDIKYNYRPIQTFNVGRQGVGVYGENPDSWEHIKTVIDNAIENRTMCVLMTHIDQTPEENIYLIEQAIDYIQERGYPILTYGEAFEIHRNRLEYGNLNMRYNKAKEYFIIDAEGEVHTTFGRAYFEKTPIADYNEDLKPLDYERNALTIQRALYSGAVKHNFPVKSTGHVYSFVSAGDGLSFRFYITTSGKLFQQTAPAQSESWGAWTELFEKTMHVEKSNLSNLAIKPANQYMVGQTIERVIYNNSSGFPVQSAGVLETIRAAGEDIYTIRKFYPVGSSVSVSTYVQRWESAGWSSWVKSTP